MQMNTRSGRGYSSGPTGRDDPIGNNGNGGNGSGGDAEHRPPPPPPLTAEQFMAAMLGSQRNTEESQCEMAAFMRQVFERDQGGGRRRDDEVNQYSSFKDFQHTNPPVFSGCVEPLDAEEWIGSIEQKFHLLRMTEELKVEYAAHQLQGPAGTWWRTQRASYGAGVPITWQRFTEDFKNNYIPPSLLTTKVEEFLSLSQGTSLSKNTCISSTICLAIVQSMSPLMLRRLFVSSGA